MTAQTPMLRQYFAVRAENPGVLLAMRVGDFYEFYGDDAVRAAQLLDITLTGREDGSNGRIPMAGVPYHAIEKYLAAALRKGEKIALCEQLEDPKTAKGLVKRGVTRILTPGTLVEDHLIADAGNAYLAALCLQGGRAGLAILDPSTGEFAVTEVSREQAQELLFPELARIRPRELLVPEDALDAIAPTDELRESIRLSLGVSVTDQAAMHLERSAETLRERLHTTSLAGFGCDDKPGAIVAGAMVLQYAERNGLPLHHVDSLTTYSVEGHLRLDPATRRSLELTQNLVDGSRRYTLLAVLDDTRTPMGARLMRKWVDQPLLDRAVIEARHAAIGRMLEQPMMRADLRDALGRIQDLERLMARCATGHASPRDLSALRFSLLALPYLEEPLMRLGVGRIQELREQVGDHRELALFLDGALTPDPPLTLREGGLFREGFDAELDKLRALSRDGKSFIAALETSERARTGITQLKVGFNAVFGYYLEVGKAHSDRVPPEYIRKQTTANAERYITADLKEQESLVLGADEKASTLEHELFQRLRTRVAEHGPGLLATARAIAELDVIASLAEVALRHRYVRPEITDEHGLEIAEGRHPVVELAAPNFVPNDTMLARPGSADRVVVLTGPNMAGKSTYLRQNALIVLMAQLGSYVPAKRARIGLCDRVFARIGAKDELALGQSTFMVEMVESANILNHATPASLVILDEVGRGTSTYDGLAIAWAMVEYLADLGAKTLFATHYHQLNALADQLPAVVNYRVGVQEIGDEIVWTHRVLPGGTDRSYGIHVARAAGIPAAVVRRASEILRDLEGHTAPTPTRRQRMQLSLFEAEEPPVIEALRHLDLEATTPLQALRLLDDWKRQFAAGS
ncbi:MAG: DNA mismatch repair protein MutS [Fimbriimonadaceae bacterium]|nr:DNA mismatch repair protein MutS [Fimbriimonadaceae bacterium]